MSPPAERSSAWRWAVCGLLLLATMLNYMDRQALAQLATTIQAEYHLTDARYGTLEAGFALAFATGALSFGFLADRLGVRWLYPAVLVGWSLSGIATAAADHLGAQLAALSGASAAEGPYLGFLACRAALGFFEAGHWPCALITTQAILTRGDRSLGNSILQSGASIGAILTPPVVIASLALIPVPAAAALGLLADPSGQSPFAALTALRAGASSPAPGSWRLPFVLIGLGGMLWAIPWLALVRRRDVTRAVPSAPKTPTETAGRTSADGWRMFLVLVITVITINLTWQFFRAWLPKFLEEQRGYRKPEVAWFISLYYIATDVGCLLVGVVVKALVRRNWDVHRARLLTFAGCAGLTLLSLLVPSLGRGPLLVAVLLLIGAGSLGLFPNYYSFTQELTRTHQGKVTGTLGTITWVATAVMQLLVGGVIERTRSYDTAIVMAGLVPLLALLALLLGWPKQGEPSLTLPVRNTHDETSQKRL